MTTSTPPDALPASKEAEAVCDAFDVLSLSEAYGGSGATSVSSRDLTALDRAVKALRAAISTAIPAGDGVPPGMAKSALDCVVHALMVLPVPIDGQGKRAWASLLEAQTILEGLSTASTDGKG